MKMLVCTDGSEHSQKALEKAVEVASGCHPQEVAIIHVYDGRLDLSATSWGSRDYALTEEDIKRIKRINEEEKEKRRQLLENAVNYMKEKNIEARSIFVEGHPSHVIVERAVKEGFDLIVIGSRGLGGLKKILLGSVSNTVVQEAKDCSVMIVKP